MYFYFRNAPRAVDPREFIRCTRLRVQSGMKQPLFFFFSSWGTAQFDFKGVIDFIGGRSDAGCASLTSATRGSPGKDAVPRRIAVYIKVYRDYGAVVES